VGGCTYFGSEEGGNGLENTYVGTDYAAAALFEHRFWLQVLGDHARFIFNALPSSEVEEAKRAEHFIAFFDRLLARSRHPLSPDELHALGLEAYSCADAIRDFKLALLRRCLQGNINIQMSPTFLNHMVNEVEEYLEILESLLAGELPGLHHPLHHHLLWLMDAAGHAAIINDLVDPMENKVKEKSARFNQHFKAFYLKAVEFAGYLRSNIERFPALSRLNRDVELEMRVFRAFLQELESWELNVETLGAFTALMADHMAREECYYLIKLSQVSETRHPDCDPGKPRTETN